VIANRTSRNIKVMNLSLGAASTETYRTDPLCRAVRRAVALGITVVAAAGNYGQTIDGWNDTAASPRRATTRRS